MVPAISVNYGSPIADWIMGWSGGTIVVMDKLMMEGVLPGANLSFFVLNLEVSVFEVKVS